MFKQVEITSRHLETGAYRFDVTAVTASGDRIAMASDPSYDSVILLTEGFGGDYGRVIDLVGSDRVVTPTTSTWRAQLAARRVLDRALESQ